MQKCITRIPVPIVSTEKENFNKHTNSDGAHNSCHLQQYKQKLSIAIMNTRVVICNYCIKICYLQLLQTLSFVIVACKSYHSFDAVLRFLFSVPPSIIAFNFDLLLGSFGGLKWAILGINVKTILQSNITYFLCFFQFQLLI